MDHLKYAFEAFCKFRNGKAVLIGDQEIASKTQKTALINRAIQNYLLTKVATPRVNNRFKPIQAFSGKGVPSPKVQNRLVKKIQAWAGSDTIESFTDGAFNTSVNQREYDFGWQAAFRTVDLIQLKDGNRSLFWNIATGKRGIRFEKIPEGGKINFAGFSGTKEVVQIERYGAGFAVTWETRNNQDYNAFLDAIMEYEDQLFGTWADVHYGLLGAAATTSGTLAYDTTGATTLDKDINSINNAVTYLANLNKDKSFGNVAERTIVAYYPLEMDARIKAALSAVVGANNDRVIQINYKVQPYRTLNTGILPASLNKYEAVFSIPGEKVQNAVHTKDAGMSELEIDSGNELHAHFTAFGAAIGDTDQVIRQAFH